MLHPTGSILPLVFLACEPHGAQTGDSSSRAMDAGDTADALDSGDTGDSGDADDTGGAPEIPSDWSRDIVATDFHFDIGTLEATATIDVLAANSEIISLEIGDLAIHSVTDGVDDLDWSMHGSTMNVRALHANEPVTLVVAYTVAPHDNFDGWIPGSGVSFLWPYFCGNLFPCHSDPSDGLAYSMNITGVPDGQTVVYPSEITADAPSYMPAFAVAAYEMIPLGTTTAGTEVDVWTTADVRDDSLAGTLYLKDAFDFYEQTYGPYTFGTQVGSVSVDWGGGDFGGMEHHPYWHVSSGSMYDSDTHTHEAAHGWFGDGVRIACWEDFVLSEGTTTYLSVHASEVLGYDLWTIYEHYLTRMCDVGDPVVVLPDETCNEIDLLTDPLWSFSPYLKGAFFYRDVAELIGTEELDRALSTFYRDHVGEAARMQEMLDHLAAWAPEQADEIDALAQAWLRTDVCPER